MSRMWSRRDQKRLEAADQRVGFAAMDGERRDHAWRRPDDDRRDVRRHALSLRHFEVGRDMVFAIAWIIARIDDFEIGVRLNRQAEASPISNFVVAEAARDDQLGLS